MTRRDTEAAGFTLIELLIVIVIIATLAAIAVPLFLNQQKKAQDAAATADVSLLGKELATWYVDNEAAPLLTHDVATHTYRIDGHAVATASTDVRLDSTEFLGRNDWCVSVVNPRGATSVTGLRYTATEGLTPGTCG